jgi:hypothetical protein
MESHAERPSLLGRFDAALDRTLVEVRSSLAAWSQHGITLRLTLVLLILHGATSPFAAAVIRLVALIMLVLPQVAERASFLWWVLAAILAISNIQQFELIDNHQYLITYWIFACATTLSSWQRLQINASALIAIVFGFAVLWKIASFDFLSGEFFSLTLLIDGRTQPIAGLFSSGGVEEVRVIGRAFRELLTYGGPDSALNIHLDSAIVAVGRGLSWGGFMLESAVACLHVVRRGTYVSRHAALLTFIAATYPILPVTGFGFVLAIMGFATVNENDRRLKYIYLSAICVLQATVVPWRNLLDF